MQTHNQRSYDPQAATQDILQFIATHPEAEQAVPYILQSAIGLTHAAGACFIAFNEGEIGLCLSEGYTEPLTAHQAEIVELGTSLAPGLHINPPVANGKMLLDKPYCLAPVISPNKAKGVLALLFEESPSPAEAEISASIQTLVNALAIVAANAEAHHQQKLAHQLATSLLNSITDPLLVLDENRNILQLNSAAERVFRTTNSKAQGKPLAEVVQSDDLLNLAHGPNKKRAEWVSEDDMTFVPRTEPIYDANSKIEGWVLALRDITHFKKLNRNQNEFTRIVSHDLRSPLTSMQGFANMLELGLVGELNEKQKHFVEKILSGISQMTALVDNIQDAGRYDPETGFYEISRSQCDLSEIVRRISDTQLVPAEKQEIAFTVSISDDVPVINADVNMLERAIINLVDNAIKYTPNGGSVEVNVAKHGEEIRISVKDTGLGISPENQKHLFERHVRIPRQEHKKIKGSGLGLFIVKSVAQRHGGDAWVVSTEGEGSIFYMSIPLSGSNLISVEA